MQTVPSILESDVSQLFYQINRLSPYYKIFQIDITDGVFVANRTLAIEEIIKSLNEKKFTVGDDLSFDFHLMVRDYEGEINKLEKLKSMIKIRNVFVHFSAVNNFGLDVLNFSSFPVGLVLNPEDGVDALKEKFNLGSLPFIQIMSVVPGAQGQPFLPEMLKKVEQLRLMDYRMEIFLDGAVNDKTLPYIGSLKYKPDIICPGSYLTKTNQLEVNVEYLKKFI